MADPVRNLVFNLDLATPEGVPVEVLRAALPPDDPTPLLLCASTFGAERTAKGSPLGPDGKRGSWRPCLAAIDRMRAAAEPYLTQSSRPKVWISGRAGLPAFYYLGRKLQFTDATFLHQPAPKDGPAVLHLPLGAPARSEPYFTISSTRKAAGAGTVALVVRTARQAVDEDKLREDLFADKRQVVGVVDLVGSPDLDADAFGAAREQLRTALGQLGTSFPGRNDLALLLAGPSHLAYLTGVMMNEHTHPRVLVYEQAEQGTEHYALAYGLPRSTGIPGPHTLLCLEATPYDENRLQTNVELREIKEGLRAAPAGGSFVVELEPAMRIRDLGDGLRRYRPRLLHLASHGEDQAMLAQDGFGSREDLAMNDLSSIISTAGSMVELVVLSMCHSASGADELARRGTMAIGFEEKVDDGRVSSFSRTFYMALASGRSVAAAFDQAKVEYLRVAAQGVPHLAVPPSRDAALLSFAPTP